MRLQDRVAIVTGGGRGIGLATARLFIQEGARVVLGDRDRAALAIVVDDLGSDWATALEVDVTRESDANRLVDEALERWGRLDLTVNSAGIVSPLPATELSVDEWRRVVDVNLTGPFLCAQAVGRSMIERGSGGRIVNIASVAGLRGAPAEVVNTIVYHVTKGGLIAFTRDLAWKWARHGITVNAIAPGWFPSDMSRVVLERAGPGLLDSVPLGRYGGEADLKGAVAYLASRASDYVTGQVLVVDGGQSA